MIVVAVCAAGAFLGCIAAAAWLWRDFVAQEAMEEEASLLLGDVMDDRPTYSESDFEGWTA